MKVLFCSLVHKLYSIAYHFVPQTFGRRAVTVVLCSIILIQGFSWIFFYQRHWSPTTFVLAKGVAQRVGAGTALFQQLSMPKGEKLRYIRMATDMNVLFCNGQFVPSCRKSPQAFQWILGRQLRAHVKEPYVLEVRYRYTTVWVFCGEGTLRFVCPTKNWLGPSGFIWLLGSLLSTCVLAIVALLFLNYQIKPLRRLAKLAKRMEGGESLPPYKPHGSLEIHQIGNMLYSAYQRLLRHNDEQKKMLLGISHDLRTLLTRMRLRIEALDKKPLEESDKQEAVQSIRGDIRRMKDMCASYTRFVETGGKVCEKKRFEVLKVCLRTLKHLEKRKEVKISMSLAKGLFVQYDEEVLERCLENVLHNAMAYAVGRIHVHIVKKKKNMMVHILDDGPGVPAQQREKIFQPFVRLGSNRKIKGSETGLGLSIVRNLLERTGGQAIATDGKTAWQALGESIQDKKINSGLCLTLCIPMDQQNDG